MPSVRVGVGEFQKCHHGWYEASEGCQQCEDELFGCDDDGLLADEILSACECCLRPNCKSRGVASADCPEDAKTAVPESYDYDSP